MHEPRPRPGGKRAFHDRTLGKVLSTEDMEIFPYIYEDAYVVDLDFSAWQRVITLTLNADHASEMRHYRAELFILEFTGVRRWDLAFNHHDRPAEAEWEREHFFWRIGHYEARSAPEGLQLTIWGEERHPRLTIVCEALDIREVPRYIVDQLYPDWSGTPRRFIRPSLDQMLRDDRT